MDNRVVVEVRNVTRTFVAGAVAVSAVQGVSLSVQRGDFVALVGPSGCGKSTLLSILGMIETPSSGELIFEGKSIAGHSEAQLQTLRRTKIGFVFQSFNLLSTLTVVENVMLPCILNGYSEEQALARADDLLTRLGLRHRLTAMPGTLSGGEMQRVAIGRAVAHQPALILADEPTGNLDSHAGGAVLSLLSEIHSQGTPIVMATHSDTAVSCCSRVLRMRDGAIIHDR
ncbi:MAG: ABC transporter ATP-binding protein [Pseudomonadota bacterium]|jgi:putative ABC transport system ATP-binding protein